MIYIVQVLCTYIKFMYQVHDVN